MFCEKLIYTFYLQKFALHRYLCGKSISSGELLPAVIVIINSTRALIKLRRIKLTKIMRSL